LVWQVSGSSASGHRLHEENGKKLTPGMPLAMGRFWDTLPVIAIAAWLLPWKPPWKETTPPRPVAVLQSFSAASTALAPVGPQNWIFIRSRMPAGSIDSCASVNASFAGEGMSRPWVKMLICAVAAATSSGWLCPRESTPAPERKSMKTLPSTSRMWVPDASATANGKCRG
jgi:hypothetical protein